MKGFMELKKEIMRDILKVVKGGNKVNAGLLVDELSLKTGMNEKTITGVLDKMLRLNYISQEDGFIMAGESKEFAPQPVEEHKEE